MEIKINPKYLALVPRPSTDEYKALQVDIVENGCREPIIVNPQGEILDGHTRYDICFLHDLPYKTEVREFPSIVDEMLYVINTNRLRRHLSNYQLIELAKPLQELWTEKAKQRQIEAGKNFGGQG
jgi:hypothetical protein